MPGVALFVYGTLQHPPLLERLLGRRPRLTPASLPGHRAARLAGRVYPGLVADDTHTAPGHVLDVDADGPAVLDVFEGEAYERRAVVAVGTDGMALPAWAWLLRDDAEALAEPWSLTRFLADDVEAFLTGSRRGGEHPGSTR